MYIISFPSGTIYKDGVEVEQRDDNPALQEYVAWLRQDNTPGVTQDAHTYPRIEVTAWKLIQALSQVGMLEQVDAAANASESPLVRMGWQRAPYFYSDESFVVELAESMHIPRDTLQSIFELAATL